MKPVLLDLFCCAGGAAKGYQRAGFEVIGVDIVPRPRYCGDSFVQGDALAYLRQWLEANMRRKFDLIHASPPCQAGSSLVLGTHKAQGVIDRHPQLVPETRRLLDLAGVPYVIEQPSSGLKDLIRTDLMLCMDMFPIGDPPWVQRHRRFEISGFKASQPTHAKGGKYRGHRGRVRGWRHGELFSGPYIQAYGHGGGKIEVPEMQYALGIDWTNVREELTEAIPPAYTEYIGRAFLADQINGKRVAA